MHGAAINVVRGQETIPHEARHCASKGSLSQELQKSEHILRNLMFCSAVRTGTFDPKRDGMKSIAVSYSPSRLCGDVAIAVKSPAT
jgi:hypothetical protein